MSISVVEEKLSLVKASNKELLMLCSSGLSVILSITSSQLSVSSMLLELLSVDAVLWFAEEESPWSVEVLH